MFGLSDLFEIQKCQYGIIDMYYPMFCKYELCILGDKSSNHVTLYDYFIIFFLNSLPLFMEMNQFKKWPVYYVCVYVSV